MARLTRNEIGAIATITGLGTAATGAVIYLASTVPEQRGRPATSVVAAAPAEHPRHHEFPLALDLKVAAVVALLLALLALWAWWQDRHRCQTCGYCPAWCRCHELADHR